MLGALAVTLRCEARRGFIVRYGLHMDIMQYVLCYLMVCNQLVQLCRRIGHWWAALYLDRCMETLVKCSVFASSGNDAIGSLP